MSIWPKHIGKSYLGGYEVEDEISRLQGETKRIYLQKTRFKDDNRIEYRFTYYVIARKGPRAGQPVFARNSVFIPTGQREEILTEAKEKGWEGF